MRLQSTLRCHSAAHWRPLVGHLKPYLIREKRPSVVPCYVRQLAAPAVTLQSLGNRGSATLGGMSLFRAFSNSLKSQVAPYNKTLINPHLLKIRAST